MSSTHRRVTSIGAALVTVAALAASVVTAAPASAANSITASDFRLQRTGVLSTTVNALDAALPNVSVADVVNSANRDMNPCSSGLPNVKKSWCWQSDDANTAMWYPQGITSTADSLGAGVVDGKQVILTSWYDHDDTAPNKGVRVSFIDASDPADPDYRHVLLVEPSLTASGASTFKPVQIHAGGLAWYGNLLYVADTTNGLRVFDMNHLWQVSTGQSNWIGRQGDGSFHAYDYRYVLPQVFRYADSTANGRTQIRHSSVSVDRTSTPDSLVVTEYRETDSTAPARTVRFGLDYTNRLLRTSTDGYARATEAYNLDIDGLQGSAVINGTWLMSESDGDANRGDLYRFRPSSTVNSWANVLPTGTEDFTYWQSRDELWTASEYPGNRFVVSVKASAYLP